MSSLQLTMLVTTNNDTLLNPQNVIQDTSHVKLCYIQTIFNETLGAHRISKSLIKRTPNIFITGFPKVTLKELCNHHASILKD